jgi:LysR family transcriptional regulator (chromosome initiation inhibitor)
LQVGEQLARGVLVELMPDNPLDVPLYWHYWRSGGQLLEQMTGCLLAECRRALVQQQ